MIQRIAERLALLKAERQRRFTELAQFDAVIAELEQLLQPPAEPKSEIITDLPPATDQQVDELLDPLLDRFAHANGRGEPTPPGAGAQRDAPPHG